MNKIRSKNGSISLYTVTVIIIVMLSMISFNILLINLMNARASSEKVDISDEEAVDDIRDDISNKDDISLTEPIIIENVYGDSTYVATLSPTGKRTSEEIKEEYDLIWGTENTYNHSPSLTSINQKSKTSNQIISFSGKTLTGYDALPNKITNTGLTVNNFIADGTTIKPVSGATKARYRINEDEYTYIEDYPTTLSLSGLTLNLGDIVTVEYLDSKKDVVGWSRFIKDNPQSVGSNLFMNIKLPNSPVMLNSKRNSHGDIVGMNMIDSYEASNSMEFTNNISQVCLTWRSYGYGYPNYASYNNSRTKTPLNYLNSPCAKMDGPSFTMVSKDLKTVITAKNQAWINGFSTVPTNTWSKIRTYWNNPPNKPAGYTVPSDTDVFNNKLYCSDPDVINEIVRQTQIAVNDYTTNWYNKVREYYQAIEDAFYAGTEYPTWEQYYPGEFNILTVSKVPCISGVKRDTLLSQYEKDLFNRSQLEINILNNLTSDYKVTIESKTDIPRVDGNLDLYYYVDGQGYELSSNDYYVSTDTGNKTNPTITVAQQLPKNYDYVDMSAISTDDNIRSEVKPMKFEILSDNVIIEKVTVEYEQLKTAEYKLQIKNPSGQVIHEELITLKNNY